MEILSPTDRAFVRQMRRMHRTWPAFVRAWDETRDDVKRTYMRRLGNIDDIRRILRDMEEIEQGAAPPPRRPLVSPKEKMADLKDGP